MFVILSQKWGNNVLKKPLYKKWWFWVLIVIVVGVIGNLGNSEEQKQASPDKEVVAEPDTTAKNVEQTSVKEDVKEEEPKDEPKEEPKEKPIVDNVPREHKAALKKAEQYAETMSMSKAGIYDQLTSEYGENFPKESSQYAIDNIVFDWKENALIKARQYAESMSMSDDAIYEQLISEYGEKFTKEEAQYAIDNLE